MTYHYLKSLLDRIFTHRGGTREERRGPVHFTIEGETEVGTNI